MVDKIILAKGIETQPRFPWEDLTESNKLMLELLLANRELVWMGHKDAETIVPGFGTMHWSVVYGTHRLYDDDPRISAANHGAACLEAMCAMVSSSQMPLREYVVSNTTSLTTGLTERSLRQHFDSAFEQFRQDMRNATEVVMASAGSKHRQLAEYVLLGASAMWQLALDSMPEPIGDFTDEEARLLGL